ncbi:MAG TPA: adenylate/guanylate cyclase domain-containing protein [Bacteroidales bacterium]|nr:adenylate/guanylate cyclase domain-containing protein [Bacteroidales bacterium]
MLWSVRLNNIFLIIFFTVFSIVSTAQDSYNKSDLPFLISLVLNGDSTVVISTESKELNRGINQNLTINQRNNNITFIMTPSDSVEYQFYLDGFDNKWSTLKKINSKEYTNLPAGNYFFHARYIYHGTIEGEISTLSVKVLPMWYFSNLAIIMYIILFALIIWAVYDHLNLRFARRLYMLEQIINNRTEDLIIEKEKTEALLANVLPKNTADELMAKGKATKIKYNFVTVLFSDIQGFTKIAEEMNPEVLIDELDKFFFYFDSVVEKYGIEKIKTIGDAYMCAGGIPEKNRTNPVEIILAALEMRIYMNTLKETTILEGMECWDIRIGIHTGTVVAGVVGHKKLTYDIWGDTVNTASRMESSGEAGKINISGTTYEFVKDFFTCEFRGKMPVKYKGELEMYFVTGIIPELRDENGGPNSKFIVKIQMIKLQDIEEMIIKMFDDEAPPNLYFHNSSLVKNIINQVELLATGERLPDEDLINLKLAAAFLLTGYISDYEKPMEASSRLVEEILPRYGFSQLNIEITKNLIRNSYNDLRRSISDNILHDAKYDYLGRVDYIKLTEKLLRERTEYGKLSSRKSWFEIQLILVSEHDFITNTAKILRSVSLEDQIDTLKLYDEES